MTPLTTSAAALALAQAGSDPGPLLAAGLLTLTCWLLFRMLK